MHEFHFDVQTSHRLFHNFPLFRCLFLLPFVCGVRKKKIMGKNPPKWLPGDRVSETILLQRKSVEQLNADRLLRRDKLKERRDRHKDKIDQKRKRKLATKKFISAQTILKHALRKQHQARQFVKIGEKFDGKHRHENKEAAQQRLSENNKVALVVRAKGKLIPTSVASAFKRMGLTKIYSARLLRITPSSERVLAQLRPFIIVGFPTTEQLTHLLRTRGALWVEETKMKRFITGNLLLEQALGQYNILCIEDLAESITASTPSENLDVILKNVAPFDLHPPRQLFLERHRTVHQKLEIVNPESFAAYLSQQLEVNTKKDRNTKRKDAKKESAAPAKKAAVKK